MPQKAAHLKNRQAAGIVTALRIGRYLQRLLVEVLSQFVNQVLRLRCAEAVNARYFPSAAVPRDDLLELFNRRLLWRRRSLLISGFTFVSDYTRFIHVRNLLFLLDCDRQTFHAAWLAFTFALESTEYVRSILVISPHDKKQRRERGKTVLSCL